MKFCVWTYRIPLPRQTVHIQRVWMEVFAIDFDVGRTVEVDGQGGFFFLFLVQHFFNVLIAVACGCPKKALN